MTEKEALENHQAGLCDSEVCKHCQREAVFIKWSDFASEAKTTKEKLESRKEMSSEQKEKWSDDWSNVEQSSKGEGDNGIKRN